MDTLTKVKQKRIERDRAVKQMIKKVALQVLESPSYTTEEYINAANLLGQIGCGDDVIEITGAIVGALEQHKDAEVRMALLQALHTISRRLII